MTRSTLTSAQIRIVNIIDELDFGSIEKLVIRNGAPCYEPPPRIVQEIKLGWVGDVSRAPRNQESVLKQEFERLFAHLAEVEDGFVDIEVRHGLPFRLVLERDVRSMVL